MKKNNSILFIVFSAIIFLMVAATAAGAMLAMANQERIAYGTTLEGIALNSLTRKEAKALIEETSQEKILASTINLTFQQKTWQIRPEEINLSVNSQKKFGDLIFRENICVPIKAFLLITVSLVLPTPVS